MEFVVVVLSVQTSPSARQANIGVATECTECLMPAALIYSLEIGFIGRFNAPQYELRMRRLMSRERTGARTPDNVIASSSACGSFASLGVRFNLLIGLCAEIGGASFRFLLRLATTMCVCVL